MTSVNCLLLVFLAIIFSDQTSGHFVKKCCPEGQLLESVPEYGGDIFKVKCIAPNLKEVPKERTKDCVREPFDTNPIIPRLGVLFPNNTLASGGGSYEVLVASSDVCGGFKIKDPYQVKTLYTDGFLVDNHGYERPYDCVDFVFNSSETRPTGIFCEDDHRAACPEGRTCLEKCCRQGKLLVTGIDGLECQESDHPMWSSDKYKSLLDSLLFETISLFYKRRNLEICYTSPSEYKIQPNGSLFNQINKSSTTSFCIDNYVKDPWREPEEVIVTLPKDCFKEREEGGVSILRILHIVATSISLFALFLTFFVYVLIPSYQNVKGKIVLVNVVFTSLLFGFLLLSHFTSPESFYLDCSTVNRLCEFLSKYSCAITGYVGYFLYMAAFAWITVLGFNFFWNISSGLQPYDSCSRSDRSFGFPVQLATVAGFLAMIFLLLIVQDLLDFPWPNEIYATHRAALSTLLSALFWISALGLDLVWTLSRDNAPAINSDNSSMRISSSFGLGVPLFLTGIVAAFHAFLPRYTGSLAEAPWYNLLNAKMGQQERCFISSGEPLTRVVLLFHLPLFGIVLLNIFFFLIIVRRIFNIKRNSIIANQSQATKELQEQMILYCKLFLVFGISWSMEPVNMALSVFFNQNQVARGFATVTSVLNLLRGFFMFLVFVSPANVKKYMHGARRTGLLGTSIKSTTTSSTSITRTTLAKKSSSK